MTKIADEFIIFSPSVSLITSVFLLVLILLSVVQEIENELSEVVLLFDRLFEIDEHAFFVLRFVIWEEVEDLVQTIGAHLVVLLAICCTNELLQELIAPQLVICL